MKSRTRRPPEVFNRDAGVQAFAIAELRGATVFGRSQSYGRHGAGAVTALLTAAMVAAPGVATAAATSGSTHAHLRVLTVSPHAGHAVKFSTRGTAVRSGRHLGSLVLNFGDGQHKKLAKLTAYPSHVYSKPGIYTLKLRIVDSHGTSATTSQKIAVAGRNRVVLRSTTLRLATSRIKDVQPTALHRENLVLAAGSTKPVVGHAVIAHRNELLPRGLIGVIRSVTMHSDGSSVVNVRDAGLAAAYKIVRIGAASAVGPSLTAAPSSATGSNAFVAYSSSAVPFSCDTSAGKSVNVSVDMSHTSIGSTINVGAHIYSFSLISKPTFSMGVSFTGKASCHLNGNISLNIPVPSVPGLVISVAPYFELSASGTIDANVSWNPFVDVFILRSPSGNQNFVDFNSGVSASASGTASVTLEGGVSLTASLAKSAGMELTAGPKITASASVSSSSSCVDVSGAIEVQAKLFANIFFVSADLILFHGEYLKRTLLHRCVAGSSGASGSGSAPPSTNTGSPSSGSSSAPYTGPTTPETTGSTANTWTDYVHAGGSQGQTIAGNKTVGVVCKIIGFKVSDGNTWWYRIGSSPWNAAYYASADAFYNNGATSGSLHGTPFVDPAVPDCAGSAGSTPTATTPPPGPSSGGGATYAETTGSVTHTWTNYSNAGGTEGQTIPSNQTVQITCKVTGFQVADGNTWWYQIASSPWSNSFYASADAFYNNGATSGSLRGTPFVDSNVPTCGSSAPPPTTHSETTGSVTHTWTNYTNAGGTQGQSIASNQTVQIACKVTGFKVADGNTWWYRIASSPWNSQFYASADAFYNNGQTSGSLSGTPFVDNAVPNC